MILFKHTVLFMHATCSSDTPFFFVLFLKQNPNKIIERAFWDVCGDTFLPFPFQNEDLNDLSKSSFNSWVPRLYNYFMIHNQDLTSSSSVDGTMHSFQFVYFIYNPQEFVDWTARSILCQAKKKKHCDTGTMSLHKLHLQP